MYLCTSMLLRSSLLTENLAIQLIMSCSGARLVILCCFLVHFLFLNGNFYVFQLSSENLLLGFAVVQGITYLCYPAIGWLADTRYTRYRMIKGSFIITLISTFVGFAIVLISIVVHCFNRIVLYGLPWYVFLVLAIPMAINIASLAMFEANAIQFGMDQMIEASSDSISAFIHWYYWSIHFSRGLMLFVSITIDTILRACLINLNIGKRSDASLLPGAYIFIFLCLVQAVMAAIGIYLLNQCKRSLRIEPKGQSAIATVYKVLMYAWQHKVPERRSALTYWEEDIPSRIDLGKSKYGGPFSTEEVENTKTLFGILLLLVSLFGLQFSDSGYSEATILVRKLCPSGLIFYSVLSSSNVFHSLVIVISVPILHYVILPHFRRYLPNMLKRLGFCLSVIFIQELIGIVIVMVASLQYNNNCPWSDLKASLRDCYLKNTRLLFNNSCSTMHIDYQWCGEGKTLFLSLLLPAMLRSFSYQWGFMTALEFICAQAPLRMKGLLIGVWYSMSTLQIHVLDNMIVTVATQWFISHGIKCFLIFLSLLMYCCVARKYRYRVRDEIVPIQFMIEEKYEKDFRLEEEYKREKREERKALLAKHTPFAEIIT